MKSLFLLSQILSSIIFTLMPLFASADSTTCSSKRILTGMISIGNESDLIQEVEAYEELLEKKIDSVVRYMDWETPFPSEACERLNAHGSIPCLVWMPHWPTQAPDARRPCLPENTGLDDILNGTHDEYIEAFARQVRAFQKPLFIKFLYEFNADWYTWSGFKNGASKGGPEKIKNVWKYVVSKFREIEANNVMWVWCPHEPSEHVSLEPWNTIANYWPGDQWVDWLGIDGFNFYPENPEREDPKYLSFDNCFRETYGEIREISHKPIQMMTGSAEFIYGSKNETKKDWVENMFSKLQTEYEGVEALFWFHYQFNENANWRVDSSPEVLEVFKRGYSEAPFVHP